MEKRSKEIILLVLAAIVLVVVVATTFLKKPSPQPAATTNTAAVEQPTATEEPSQEEEKAELPTAQELLGRSPGTSPQRNPFAGAAGTAPVQPAAKAAPKENASEATSTSSAGAMPPLVPVGMGGDESTEPNVLTLKGVIIGNRSLALLRRGETRYFAFRGSTIDGNYVITKISPSSITLRSNDGNQIILQLGGGR